MFPIERPDRRTVWLACEFTQCVRGVFEMTAGVFFRTRRDSLAVSLRHSEKRTHIHRVARRFSAMLAAPNLPPQGLPRFW